MRLTSAVSALLLLAIPHVAAAADASASDGDAAVQSASSDALPAQLTLSEALRLFRVRGFDLLLADAQVASAHGDVAIAGASPNPSINGSVGRAFGYDSSQCPGCSALGFSVGVSESGALSDLISNKRGLRLDVAQAALSAAQQSREDAARTLELTLKQAWIAALQAEAQLALSVDAKESTERTRALNEKRFSLGAVSEADLARAEVAELEAEQLHDQATQALDTAKAQLAFLLGARGPMPTFALDPHGLDFALPAPLAQATSDSLLAQALELRPDLRATQEQVKRAHSAVALSRRQRWGDPDLSLSYAQQGTGQNAITPPTLTLGLSIPLPLAYQQQGEIAKSEADLRMQEIGAQKAQAQVANDVRAAYSAFVSARAQVERMDGKLFARAKRARDLIEVQYAKGAATLLDLLDAQRTLLAVSGERLNLLATYWNAVAQLEAAVAKELRT